MQASRSPALRQSRFAGSAAVVTANRSLLIGRHAAAAQRPSRHICNAAAVQIQAGLQQLLNWAASNKAVVDKVTIADDIATDQPVYVAAKDIAAGEQVFAVPESAWLTTSSAQQSSIGKYITGLEPWLQLALLLLAERSQPGGSSKLGPYLAAAADSSSTLMRSPLFWSEDELQLLQGTQLLESVRGYKQFFQEQYEALNASLFSPNRALFPASTFTAEGFAWAVATVRSRLHAPLDADSIALVPLADALPHQRAGTTTWKLKQSGVFGRSQVLAVEASKALRKGEGLTLDYGPDKLDNTLLLDYGVLDTRNPKSGYSLTLTLPESDRYFDDKLDILERNGLGASATFNIVRGEDPPYEMMGFLRLMQLQGGDCFLLESIFEAEVWGFMCDPVSEPNESAVCAAMVEGAAEALAGYGSSIEDDLALLRGGSLVPGSRQELAVQVRLGEKEALDGLMAFFEGRAADLKALQYYQERRLKRLGLMDEDGSTTYDSFFRDGIA